MPRRWMVSGGRRGWTSLKSRVRGNRGWGPRRVVDAESPHAYRGEVRAWDLDESRLRYGLMLATVGKGLRISSSHVRTTRWTSLLLAHISFLVRHGFRDSGALGLHERAVRRVVVRKRGRIPHWNDGCLRGSRTTEAQGSCLHIPALTEGGTHLIGNLHRQYSE